MATLSILTGGTAGSNDGTLVSAGNKITITGLSPSYVTVYLRSDTEDTYSTDQAFTIPSGVEISFDGGSTWKTSSDSPYTYSSVIGDRNVAMRVRQPSIVGSPDATLTTDGTFSACTVLGTVSGFTATAGTEQVSLSWSAVTNSSYYWIERATDSGFTTGVTTLTNTETTTSYTDTGLTAGTVYYYRIKALGLGAYSDSASYATANATPTANPLFTDNFNDSSLDTTRFGTITNAGGTVTETTSLALADDGTTSNKIACVYLKAEVSLSTARTYRARVVGTSGTEGVNLMTLYGTSGSAPVYADLATIDNWTLMWALRPTAFSGTSLYYNTGTWTGAAMTGQTNLSNMSTSNYYDCILEVAQNTGTWQVRSTIKNNSGTVISQSSWVNASSLHSATKYYIVLGRPYTTETANGSMTVQQFQVS